MLRRTGITLAALTTLATLAVPAAAKAASANPAAPEIRLNQVGYQPNTPKAAYVMLPARVASIPFTVTDAKGTVVYRGVSRDDVGALEFPLQGGLPALVLAIAPIRDVPGAGRRGRVAVVHNRQRNRALRAARHQRGPLLHL